MKCIQMLKNVLSVVPVSNHVHNKRGFMILRLLYCFLNVLPVRKSQKQSCNKGYKKA